MTLPMLELHGTPWEQGWQHGRQLKPLIFENLKVYFHRFEHESGLSRQEVIDRAERYAPEIEAISPDYYQGMAGIASGSGVPLIEIVALNVRYEIIYYQSMVNALSGRRDGCTSFAVSPSMSANEHLIMGQNWDWIPGVKGAVLRTQEPDELETLSFTEAGIYGGKIGCNSAGIGLAVNGLTSTADNWELLGTPFHVRCYQILRQHDLDSAETMISGSRRAFSANFLIAQAPDNAVDIEASPDALNRLAWQDGLIVHSNHFLDPDSMGISEPPNHRRESTCHRLERMTQFLLSDRPISVEDIKCHLQDHTLATGSICRHEDTSAPVGEQYRTVTSIIMDLQARVLEITDGPPCCSSYEKHVLR